MVRIGEKSVSSKNASRICFENIESKDDRYTYTYNPNFPSIFEGFFTPKTMPKLQPKQGSFGF